MEAAASKGSPAGPEPVRLPVVVPVAGVSFRQEVVRRLRGGDPVALRREPENPFDAAAVAVETGDDLAGYLPRPVAARFTGTGPWRGEVVEVLAGGDLVGVRVRVTAEVPGAVTRRQVRVATAGAVTADDAVAGRVDTVDGKVAGRVVRSRAGRLLGPLVADDDVRVVADTPAGPVAFPAAAVVVEDR